MSCKKPEISEQILAWLDGALPAEDADLFEKHISSCPWCQQDVAELRVLTGQISDAYQMQRTQGIPALCPPTEDLIDLAAGTLPAVRREQVQNHLEICPSCAEQTQLLQALEAESQATPMPAAAIEALATPAPPMPEALREAFHQATNGKTSATVTPLRAARPTATGWLAQSRHFLAMAATVAIIIGVTFVLSTAPPTVAPPTSRQVAAPSRAVESEDLGQAGVREQPTDALSDDAPAGPAADTVLGAASATPARTAPTAKEKIMPAVIAEGKATPTPRVVAVAVQPKPAAPPPPPTRPEPVPIPRRAWHRDSDVTVPPATHVDKNPPVATSTSRGEPAVAAPTNTRVAGRTESNAIPARRDDKPADGTLAKDRALEADEYKKGDAVGGERAGGLTTTSAPGTTVVRSAQIPTPPRTTVYQAQPPPPDAPMAYGRPAAAPKTSSAGAGAASSDTTAARPAQTEPASGYATDNRAAGPREKSEEGRRLDSRWLAGNARGAAASVMGGTPHRVSVTVSGGKVRVEVTVEEALSSFRQQQLRTALFRALALRADLGDTVTIYTP
ncbi:MAG: zf-HC2 domain-containing protein [Armatimonadetes bacterium]|nr:zf-HC2 domain-containing protein [Armatimonadota bacterium]